MFIFAASKVKPSINHFKPSVMMAYLTKKYKS